MRLCFNLYLYLFKRLSAASASPNLKPSAKCAKLLSCSSPPCSTVRSNKRLFCRSSSPSFRSVESSAHFPKIFYILHSVLCTRSCRVCRNIILQWPTFYSPLSFNEAIISFNKSFVCSYLCHRYFNSGLFTIAYKIKRRKANSLAPLFKNGSCY